MKFKIGKCAKGWRARDVERWKRANVLTFGDDWRDQLEDARTRRPPDGPPPAMRRRAPTVS